MSADHQTLSRFVNGIEDELKHIDLVCRVGKVSEVVGTLIRARGLTPCIGEVCRLYDARERLLGTAEVVGFAKNEAILSPFGAVVGVTAGQTQVLGTGQVLSVPVGDELLGRVINSIGDPIDDKGALACMQERSVIQPPPSPMTRTLIERPLPTGIRSIDGLLTIAEGQRVGVFAPAGVGKSSLLGMLVSGAACDVIVIALIGERGRKVREFVEVTLGGDKMKRCVVVCATSDRSAIERAKAAHAATTIAEYFRDRGLRVLLLMDSLTRFARALREIGLAAGEPAARRGFPPSVFAEIPRLLERAGMGRDGSITALYTVLAEDESNSDPISEEVRGLLDGHIVLSRAIAARAQYPAVDVLASLSRLMNSVTSTDHREAATRFRQLLARYQEIETLIQIGEYKAGADAMSDMAVQRINSMRDFLAQRPDERCDLEQTVVSLKKITT